MGNRASRGGQTAIKVIVAVGVLAFLFLILSATALKRFTRRDEGQQVRLERQASLFRGERAFDDVQRIASLGPRPSGSEGHAALRTFIRTELGEAGLNVSAQPFEVDAPDGPRSATNLWTVSQGSVPGTVILAVHYDAAPVPDPAYVGANENAVGVAWLIEMARTLGASRPGCTVWCVFLDGFHPVGGEDEGLHGSTAFVDMLRERRKLADIKAFVYLNGIGDRYLGVRRDTGAARWLAHVVWDPASELGYERSFLSGAHDVDGDQVPFRRAGVPSMALVDDEYGGSGLQHKRLWHTAQDTVEHVAPESLQAVGDVMYHALSRMDARLDTGAAGEK